MPNDSAVGPAQSEDATQRDLVLDTAALAVICLVGLFGNALIIVCVIVHKKMKNVTSLFAANLAAADLLLAVVVAPGSARLLWRQRDLPLSPMCQVFGAALYFSCAAVVNFSALIALTRYIVICKPHLVVCLFRHRRSAAWCVGLWCYTLLQVAVPSAAKLFNYTYNPVMEVCHLNYTKHPVAIAVYINGVCFMPCLVACVVCYALIFCALCRSRRKLTRHMSSAMSATFLAKKLRRERRATMPLFVSLLSFFVHWLPVMVMFGLDSNVEKYNPKIHRYLGIFSIASACDNWVIYGLLNRNFATGYRLVLCYYCCCLQQQSKAPTPQPDSVKIRREPGRRGTGQSQSRYQSQTAGFIGRISGKQASQLRGSSSNSRNSRQYAVSCHYYQSPAGAPLVSELEDYNELDSWYSQRQNELEQAQEQGEEAEEDEDDDEYGCETDEFDRINEICCGGNIGRRQLKN